MKKRDSKKLAQGNNIVFRILRDIGIGLIVSLILCNVLSSLYRFAWMFTKTKSFVINIRNHKTQSRHRPPYKYKGGEDLKKHFNLYYIFMEDWFENPIRKEAREKILKVLNLFFEKDKNAALPSTKEKND